MQQNFARNNNRTLENLFSWSFSRGRMFEQCLRKYYWNYYGSWSGWEREAGPQTQLAYRLKQMSSLALWAGEIVHSVAERAAKEALGQHPPDSALLKQWARNTLNRQWQESLEQKWKQNAKHNLNLFEHYYRQDISAEQRTELREKIYRCIDHLLACAPLREIQQLGPTCAISIEKLQTFTAEQVSCYVKIDLAFRRANGEVVLVDWKSGAQDPLDREQMLNYALFAVQELRTPPDQIRLLLVYLQDGTLEEWTPRPEALIAFREKIFGSIGRMQELLDDPRQNSAAKKKFPLTEHRAQCAWCFFRELCYENSDPRGTPIE